MSKTTKSRPLRNDHRRPHSFGSVPAQMIQRTILQHHRGGASVRLSCMPCLIARHVMPTSPALIQNSRSWRRGDSFQRPFYTSMRRTLVSGAYTKCKPLYSLHHACRVCQPFGDPFHDPFDQTVMQVVVVHSSVERKTEYCGVKLGRVLEYI